MFSAKVIPLAVAAAIFLLAASPPARAAEGPSLIESAYAGNEKEVLALIDAKADVNQVDENGYTALHWAAYNGSLAIANLLIEHGAHLNGRDRHGCTPLMVAAARKKADVAEALLKRGALLDVVSADGFDALAYAGGDPRLAALLTPRVSPPRDESPPQSSVSATSKPAETVVENAGPDTVTAPPNSPQPIPTVPATKGDTSDIETAVGKLRTDIAGIMDYLIKSNANEGSTDTRKYQRYIADGRWSDVMSNADSSANYYGRVVGNQDISRAYYSLSYKSWILCMWTAVSAGKDFSYASALMNPNDYPLGVSQSDLELSKAIRREGKVVTDALNDRNRKANEVRATSLRAEGADRLAKDEAERTRSAALEVATQAAAAKAEKQALQRKNAALAALAAAIRKGDHEGCRRLAPYIKKCSLYELPSKKEGEALVLASQVESVLPGGIMLLQTTKGYRNGEILLLASTRVFVRNMPPLGLVDGDDVTLGVIKDGAFSYNTRDGGQATVHAVKFKVNLQDLKGLD